MKEKSKLLTYFTNCLFVVASIEIIIVAIFFTWNDPLIKNTLALATTTKPETFTELYFQDHTKLPHSLTISSQYSFTFTIKNLENKDMHYPYEFYVDLGKEKLLLDKGNVFIKKGATKNLTKTFVVNDMMKRSKFVISLTDKKQQISFWGETHE